MYLKANFHPWYNYDIISVVVGLGPANKMCRLFVSFYIKLLQ